MLGSASFGDTVVIADLEAGIGTLTRLEPSTIDIVVIVVEPTPRSIDVALRAAALADERQQGRTVIVANRVLDYDDEARVRSAFEAHEVVVVPYDSAVADADRAGLAVLDTAPDSPAVRALAALADRLTPA